VQYEPTSFQIHDPQVIETFIARHPFGTLIAVADDFEPCIAHIPMLLEGGVSSGLLSLHLARANPLSTFLLDGGRVATAIFHGPHAHISPRSYATEPAVPTWNYMVVHLRGRVHPMDQAASVAHLLKLSAIMEGEGGWQPDAAPDGYIEKLAGAIQGFQLQAGRVSAKFKLSQNRAQADRNGVLEQLLASGDAQARELAEWMRTLGVAGSHP